MFTISIPIEVLTNSGIRWYTLFNPDVRWSSYTCYLPISGDVQPPNPEFCTATMLVVASCIISLIQWNMQKCPPKKPWSREVHIFMAQMALNPKCCAKSRGAKSQVFHGPNPMMFPFFEGHPLNRKRSARPRRSRRKRPRRPKAMQRRPGWNRNGVVSCRIWQGKPQERPVSPMLSLSYSFDIHGNWMKYMYIYIYIPHECVYMWHHVTYRWRKHVTMKLDILKKMVEVSVPLPSNWSFIWPADG